MSAAHRKSPRRLPAPESPGEEELALHIRAYGLEPPRRQYLFAEHLGRAFAMDFAWPDRMLTVEIDGAVHRIKGRFRADLERHNLAQVLGWRVLRFSPADVKSAKAVDTVRAVLAGDEQAALAAIQRK